MSHEKKEGRWEWKYLPLPGCVSYMGNTGTALGWELKWWRGACLHPASISVTKIGQGKHKSFKGQWTGSQEYINTARMIASFLFYQKTNLKIVWGGQGGVLCASSPHQHCHLCRDSSKSDFPQVRVRKWVCAGLVHRSNDWPRSAAFS